MYILRDPELEARLGLPTGEFEMPLMIMDRGLNPDGSLQYPAELVPEYFTNVSIVNGQAWPKMTVQPARYRFRLLAAGNARFFNLQLFVVDKTTGEPDFKRPGPPFVVIAGEGGFFEEPVTVDGRMLVAPAERYDIVIDFTNFAGQKLLLHNDAGTPYSGPGAASGNEVPLPDIMQFHVKKAAAKEEVAATPDEDALPVAAAPIATPGPLPKRLVPRSEPVPAITKDTPEWRIDLNEYTDDQGRLMLLLEHSHCSDPILTKPVVNQTSVFAFVNPTPDWHPMHMHLVSFHVLGHTPFDLALYEATGEVVPTGPTEEPKPWETAGTKDVVGVPNGFVTRVAATPDRLGPFMFHCHILEHEEWDMMRFYEVVPTLEQQKRWAPLLQGGEAASRVHLDAYERSLAEDWVQARQQIDRIEARGKAHAGMHGGMTRVTHGHEAHQHSGPGM